MIKTLVIGNASNVLEDIKKVDLESFDWIISVNRALLLFPTISTHWITLHPENLPSWETELQEPLPEECVVISFHRERNLLGNRIRYQVDEEFDYLFEGQTNSGSSGLYGVKYSIEKLKSDQTVLVGVPMDPILCHYSDSEFWAEGESFWNTWVNLKNHLIDNGVRSLSGRTKTLLGAPE